MRMNTQYKMTKEDILKRLEEISSKPGFIYTLVIMLRQDLFLDPSESADMDWTKKISFQEFTLLIGLMVKHKIEIIFPTEEQSRADNTEVYELFQELHKAHMTPFLEKFKAEVIDKKLDQASDEEKETAFNEFFGSGDLMAEPMFYGGSGAYDFQYTELAIKKYSYDSAWIKKERGFTIERAEKIASELKRLSEQKSQKISKLKSFEDFCSLILDIFCFSIEDIGGSEDQEAQAFLGSFSLEPANVNQKFNTIGQYNALASHPIVKLNNNRLYFLPIGFVLTGNWGQELGSGTDDYENMWSNNEKHVLG